MSNPGSEHASRDTNVHREAQVDKAIDDQLGRTSDHAAIADASAVGSSYSQSEVNALRTKINEILDVLRDAGLIPSS
jgi:hypothetical protein